MNSNTPTKDSTKTAALYSLYSYMNHRPSKIYLNPLDKILQSGLTYLESSYTLHYGWIPETCNYESLEQSQPSVPILFDTPVILDTLSDAGISLSESTTQSAISWIMDNQIKDQKVWNFFSRDFYVIPHEPDTTSNVICCLYGLNVISKEEAVKLAGNMIPKMWFHEDDGTMDVYYKQDCGYVWPKWTPRKRIDAGVIANVMYCLGRLEMTEILNGPKFDPCFNVLNEVLDDMLIGKKNGYLKNYEDFDVALLLISRMVRYSDKAEILFGEKIRQLVKGRFGRDRIAIHLGCRILAAFNLGMVEMYEDLVLNEARFLVELREGDFSGWPKWAFYSAHGKVYFGSKAVTTAFAVAALELVKNFVPTFSEDFVEKVENGKMVENGKNVENGEMVNGKQGEILIGLERQVEIKTVYKLI